MPFWPGASDVYLRDADEVAGPPTNWLFSVCHLLEFVGNIIVAAIVITSEQAVAEAGTGILRPRSVSEGLRQTRD